MRLKRKATAADIYDALVFIHRALPVLVANTMRPRISAEFVERLMLTVTEVNGCPACSYAHARLALAKGISREEIDAILAGSHTFGEPEETTALLFGQHYAATGARPDPQALLVLEREYGAASSRVIISAIQMMMAGNMVGLPLSALWLRLKGTPAPASSLAAEIGLPLLAILAVPISAVHSLIRGLAGKPNYQASQPPETDGSAAATPPPAPTLRGERVP